MGQVPDAKLAKEISSNRGAVAYMRRRLNIKPYDPLARAAIYYGRLSDGYIARHFGMSETAVWKRRRNLGIPPYDRRRGNAAALLDDYLKHLET
jgi:hypothetical protein